MYGKIFDSMYDGTLVEDWRALITFQQMIVLCDADGTIDMTPAALSRRTGIPIEHIKAGIEILENPDPYSRTPNENGCRIVRLDDHRPWGWSIVNHKLYRDMASKEDRRQQNKINKQNQRAREGVSKCQRPSAMSAHTDTDTDTNKTYRAAKRVPKKWELSEAGKQHAKKHGMSDSTLADQLQLFRDHEYKTAKKDWDACWRTWCTNWKKWNPGDVVTAEPYKHRKPYTPTEDELRRDREKAEKELAALAAK